MYALVKKLYASKPESISTRLRFDPMDDSPVSTINPTSWEFETCVPPHSSFEKLPILTTLTSSSYLSPKKARAPSSLAFWMFIMSVWIFKSPNTLWLLSLKIISNSSFETLLVWLKSKRNFPGATWDPACATCDPNIFRRDACTICAAVWLLETAFLKSESTTCFILSPISISE